MTVRLTHDVYCDKCGVWVHCFVAGESRIREVRCIARDLGWVRKKTPLTHVLRDLCPDCAEKGD